jgi:hypothetical protein
MLRSFQETPPAGTEHAVKAQNPVNSRISCPASPSVAEGALQLGETPRAVPQVQAHGRAAA